MQEYKQSYEGKYRVRWTSRFKKEYRLAKKRGYDIKKLKEVVQLLAKGDEQERLIKEYDDHVLLERTVIFSGCKGLFEIRLKLIPPV